MSRTARLWKGVGPATLGGLLLSCGAARAADTPLSQQLTVAGRQALAQGRPAEARSILIQALKLDPKNAQARASLAKTSGVRLVSYQEAADPPAEAPVPPPAGAAAPVPEEAPASTPAAPPVQATLAEQARLESIRRQEFNSATSLRLQRARDLTNAGRPEEALSELRTTLNAVQSADEVSESDRRRLENQVRAQIGSTEAIEERVALERADLYRRQSADEARLRTLAASERNQDTIGILMAEFDNLMTQGTYLVFSNAGTGDIDATTAPFTDARARAVAARAIDPYVLAPYAALFTSQTKRFLSQTLSYEELKRYRALLTWQDVDRSSIPFPDTKTIEFPRAEAFVALTEKRRARYTGSEVLLSRDSRTKGILTQLNERLAMPFPQETPLEEVLKYIRTNTVSEELDLPAGIPIYVDPVGLQEADKTITSPITLDLDGIPLKTSLRLILKQLDLTYTVKDGLMTITSAKSDDQPTEIRVYPVADLSIIPISLMGGGGGGMGGGGMGGGMGGGGMGGGGMGGGGMGGGMGGGGMGGGMGGMGTVPPQDPSTLSPLEEKKSR